MATNATTTASTRAPKRSKQELFIEKGQIAVAKLKANYAELRELATKYKGGFTAEQKETIFKYIEEQLQVPTEKAFNDVLAGKANTAPDGFSLAPVAADTEKK